LGRRVEAHVAPGTGKYLWTARKYVRWCFASRYTTCENVTATAIRAIHEDGRWDVFLRATDVPLDVARPTVFGIVHRLNQRYSLKKPLG
jgi:hypothetical protein